MNEDPIPSPQEPSGLSGHPDHGDSRGPETHLEELLGRLQEHRPAKSRFEVVRRIARGGMGVVLEVWDPDLRRRLAMKALQRRDRPDRDSAAEALMRERMLTRFFEEAQVTGQLGHPGIVPLHEMGLDDQGRPFFTMPLVRGRTLADISEEYRAGQEPWTLPRLLGVLQKVCEAVAYAHSKGVIHRDLKPANIMVGRFGETYVMDWGLARVLGRPDAHDLRLRVDEDVAQSMIQTDRADAHLAQGDSPILTMDGDVIGTPAYMPPEQAAGCIEELGPRSDVYALGAILYFLLVGRDPYTPPQGRGKARQVLTWVLTGPPRSILELAPEAPPDLVAIAERAMARRPGERYADAMELAEELAAFLERRPVQAAPPTLRRLLSLWVARNRAVALTAAAATTLLLLSSGVFVVGLDDARRKEQSARIESEARADVLLARDLLAREPELHPPTPATEPALADWVDQARGLLDRRTVQAASLMPVVDGAIEEFPEDLEGVRQRLPEVEERLARAQSLRRETVEAHAEDWRRAAEEVRSSEVYGGLELAPQVGLVPLGADPASGLQEFWHVLSGARPEGAPGDWEITEETGIVLVLLPGGEYEMGSPEDEPGRNPEIEPPHSESVEAFFCAKHEVTQAQWRRVLGGNPSRFQPELVRSYPLTEAHPVEMVSWHEAREFARRNDLRLPTEVEWEYAARAGSTERTYGGDELADLETRANVRDASAAPSYLDGAGWTDGFRYHAPVGSFRSNAFGLHDTIGNVSEWCADSYWVYPGSTEKPLRSEGDGRALQRMVRGGSWYHVPAQVRSGRREFKDPRGIDLYLGARMARSLRAD